MDPVTGRDDEIRQIVDILMRRRQNNPILTGEAGVGKTAVVEGFAQRLARGDVPPQLQGVSLLSLDLGLLQAGASMKGEFEQRLRQLIDEVQASPKPIILFIDEVHTLVGAGGAAGTGDAANLLKPALARGTLRTIGATTWAEYKKHIEKDPALTRRFQVVQIPEPDELKAVLMLRGVATVLEKHHRVQLLDEAIESAVKLSHRYIPARQLPDKAVSLLDTACARVAVSQHAIPAEVEDCRRRIESLEIESAIIDRESAVGVDVGTRRSDVDEKLGHERERLVGLRSAGRTRRRSSTRCWPCARNCAATTSRSIGRRPAKAATSPARRSGAGAAEPIDREKVLAELREQQARLAALQGDTPLIMPSVDAQAVASVVADWTGIPVGRMVKNELQAILQARRRAGQARHRPAARPRHDRPPHPDLARPARQPEQADRRLHALRHVGRRQDRDRAGPRRSALRRRAERHHHQHERVPGGAHRLLAQGRAARLCGLRRGRHPDRGGAAPALQRRAARRGREGPPGRARAVLPGLRQGPDGRRRRPDDRLQEHDHPAHQQRRIRADHEHVQGPGAAARSRFARRRR